jgi:hypothetical protein
MVASMSEFRPLIVKLGESETDFKSSSLRQEFSGGGKLLSVPPNTMPLSDLPRLRRFA